MFPNNFRKIAIVALLLPAVFLLAGLSSAWAYSVDVSSLSYTDNLDPSTLKRIVNYDFSAGSQTVNIITIPDSFITKPASDSGLSYTFGPYPDETNDISIALDTGAHHVTLSSASSGGCIMTETPSSATISFNGTVIETISNSAIENATVSVVAGSNASTTTDGNGNFGLTGIPPGQNFELAINKTGFTPVYSEIFNWTQDIQTLLPYGLFPLGTLATWGVTSGNGAIIGRVTQLNNPTGFLAGATLTAVNAANPGQSFPVIYQDSTNGSLGGTATYDNGVFVVLNVPDGVTVQLTAAMSGWSFVQASSWLTIRSGAFSETSFFATETGAGSISGQVSAGSSGYTSGNIYLSVYDAAWPTGNRLGKVTLTAPGGYAISNLPTETNLYVYARWDKDGSNSRTPGDWTGQYQANPVMITGGANPANIDITLNSELAATTVSGMVSSNDFQAGLGDLKIFAYDGPDATVANRLAITVINGSAISGTSVSYTLSNLAVNAYVYIFCRWDRDGDGVSSPADYRGGYLHSPLLVQSSGHTGIDITLNPGTPIPQTLTAGGTFDYVPGTSLTLHTTSSDFTCQGPPVGDIVLDIISVTETTATLIEQSKGEQMTWTRASGTAGDIVGTWQAGNGFAPEEITFNSDYSFLYTSNSDDCSGGGDEGPEVYSVWTGIDRSMTEAGTTDTTILHFHLWAPTGTVSQIDVSGPSLPPSGSHIFTENFSYLRGDVVVDDFSQDIPVTIDPVVGDVYNFTVTKTDSSTVNVNQTIGEVLLDAPLVTSPTGHALTDANLDGPLTITWTLPAGMTQSAIVIQGGVCAGDFSSNFDGTVTTATSATITLPDLGGVTGAYIDILVHHGDHVFARTKYDFGSCGYIQDMIPPNVPANLAAVADSATQITLSWDPSTDNIGVEGYKVYRDGSEIGATIAPSFTDSNLQSNTTYCYTVTAYDLSNNFSDFSNQSCAQTSGSFYAYSYHQSQESGYYILSFADDPNQAFSGVTVNGPGQSGDVAMTYNPGSGRWESSSIALGTTLPTGPRTYNFSATPTAGGNPVTGSVTVSVYVEHFASNLQPVGDVTTIPSFSWTGFAEASSYTVIVGDLSSNWFWSSANLEAGQTSVLYDGPALTTGQTYRYMVIGSDNTDGNSNSSFAEAQFTYIDLNGYQVWAESAHDDIGGSPSYYGNFFVPDAAHGLTAVTVTGPGIADVNGMALTYRDDVGEWWTVPRLNFGQDLPVNLLYTFTLIDNSGQQSVEKIVNGGVETLAVPIAPLGDQTGDITFTFTGVAGAESYRIGLGEGSDPEAGGSIVWVSDSVFSDQATVTIPYNGPSLATGSYNYTVHAFIGDNSSMARAVFNYMSGGTTLTLKSESSTLAAATGPAGIPAGSVLSRLDTADTSGLSFAPVAVGGFGSGTPVPPGAPSGTLLVNIAQGDGANGYFKLTFTLPAEFRDIHLTGAANVDDRGRVFLNGNPLTSSLVNMDQNTVTQSGNVVFSSGDSAFFRVGENEILVSDANTGAGPSGGAFYAIVTYGESAAVLKGDVDGNETVAIADAIMAMQTVAGLMPSGIRPDYTVSGTDVNGDGRIGMAEVIYILQSVANLRNGNNQGQVMPYTSDGNTVLLDHLDGSTGATILAYRETGAQCGSAKPSATPNFSYVSGPDGLNQSLLLSPPVGEPAGSTTYFKYPGGQLLSQSNGTIEFWVYLTGYGNGLSLVSQGPYPGSCAGWTLGMGVNGNGQLQAGAWAAFNMNSGTTAVPLNTWTHIAASWGSQGGKLYMNGTLVGSDVNTGMPAGGYGGSVMINYGANVATRIDELRISNIQRTTFSVGGF